MASEGDITLAHVHSSHKDVWGSGKDGVYIVAKGFSALQSPHISIFPPTIWKSVWASHCMLKVNFFLLDGLKKQDFDR